ncbi:MAG: acetoacetate--CoA ligase [Acidobacteriota bacterium]|nr:acetoacetate--CoA ligase [Acidobacteriota bacterium]
MTTTPQTLWEPSDELRRDCLLTDYLYWLHTERRLEFGDYQALWKWSVERLEDFWQSVADYFEVAFHNSPECVLSSRKMPGARFFPGSTLNYAEHALRGAHDHPAVIYRAEDGSRTELSWEALRDRVARARAGMLRLGVGRGDRVVAFLPNNTEALIAMLATASLGAAWSSCPPEFGTEAVLDRFRQIQPKLLLGVGGYRYGGRSFDRLEALETIAAGLPSLEARVLVTEDSEAPGGWSSWAELTTAFEPLVFEPVPFDHPLWILYSSGTTGLPKAIIHGHGGITLEHFKALALHGDLRPGDRFFWFSTTGWMMWNYLVSGLLVGSTVVLYDGSPGHPDLEALYRLADEEGVTFFGVSAPYLMACRKGGLSPHRKFSFSELRSVGSTGAPLPAEGFRWVYEHVKKDLLLASVSGGTDVCSAFVLGCPLLPVREGELQCLGLGARVEAYSESGHPLVDETGELVITEPMPSMPVGLWNDPQGARYRASYFEDFPGVWRHGDWISIDHEGRSVIYGRSDSTLNRGGVRMGTSEFYTVLEGIPEIVDSIIVDTGTFDEPGKLWLFVQLDADNTLGEELTSTLRATLRSQLSPRHVPDEIRAVPAIPTTLSGKKLEVPIKKILNGTPVEEAANRETLQDPNALDALVAELRR